jgi:malic enzyme
MKIAAAHALADYVTRPQKNRILPPVLDREVVKAVSRAVIAAANRERVCTHAHLIHPGMNAR